MPSPHSKTTPYQDLVKTNGFVLNMEFITYYNPLALPPHAAARGTQLPCTSSSSPLPPNLEQWTLGAAAPRGARHASVSSRWCHTCVSVCLYLCLCVCVCMCVRVRVCVLRLPRLGGYILKG